MLEKTILTIKNLSLKIEKNSFKLIVLLSFLYPLFLSLNNILNASIPFWYDPARDFLLALDNLKRPTLIGPPSGIPSVFYGPYWIWLISAGLVFSRDPRVVAILVSLVPYFAIFPFVLLKLSRIYGKKVTLLMWLLFIFSFRTYTTYLWNPHLAPLLYLILTYMLISLGTGAGTKYLINMVSAGIVSGLLLNFHISFGLGIFVSSVIYLCWVLLIRLKENRNNTLYKVVYGMKVIFLFIIGFFITLIPYALFELRHNFLQSRALHKTITDAVFYNSASVGQTGLKPPEIISKLFIERTSQLLSIKTEYTLVIYFLAIGFIIYNLVRKKLSFSENDRNIIIYSFICLLVLSVLFTSSKNPVWQYHFIGVEIIILLLVGIALKKWKLLRDTCSFWIAVLVVLNLASFLGSYTDPTNPLTISSLATKKYIVERIYHDASGKPFSVFAYSPAIYTFDFDYIFNWLGKDIYHQLPESDSTKVNFIYLIIPKTSDAIQADFINWRTPAEKYVTVDKWIIPDGTTVIKRVVNS